MPAVEKSPERVWTSPAGMYVAGLEYFSKKDEEKKPYTLSGLALHLGMSYVRFMGFYEKYSFAPVIDMLKSRILEQAETHLYDRFLCTGAKFHAAQLGMTEKSVIESRNTNVTVTYEGLKDLSDADLEILSGIVGKITHISPITGGDGSPEEEQNPLTLPGIGTTAP